MKKIFGALAATVALCLAGQSGAADLGAKGPVYTKAPPAAAVFSWNGFYAGAHVGGAWSDTTWCRDGSYVDGCAAKVSGENFASVSPNGALGGLQLGYNWQQGQFVLGIEGDFSFADLKGNSAFRTFNSNYAAHTSIDDIATVAARFGIAVDRALFYAKVGAAWASNDHWIVNVTDGITYAKTDSTRSGWMVGAGLEYALLNNWSAKIEYNYLNFGSHDYTVAGAGGGGYPSTVTIDQNIHVVKAGLNYRFGGPY